MQGKAEEGIRATKVVLSPRPSDQKKVASDTRVHLAGGRTTTKKKQTHQQPKKQQK